MFKKTLEWLKHLGAEPRLVAVYYLCLCSDHVLELHFYQTWVLRLYWIGFCTYTIDPESNDEWQVVWSFGI